MANLSAKRCKVVEIQLDVKDDVKTQDFAMAFLAIYNNCRENKDVFLDMRMTYDSTLVVIVHPEHEKVVVDWLKGFDYVWNTDTMKVYNVARTIIDDYDDDFDEDILLKHVGDYHSLDEFEKIQK